MEQHSSANLELPSILPLFTSPSGLHLPSQGEPRQPQALNISFSRHSSTCAAGIKTTTPSRLTKNRNQGGTVKPLVALAHTSLLRARVKLACRQSVWELHQRRPPYHQARPPRRCVRPRWARVKLESWVGSRRTHHPHWQPLVQEQ